MASLDSNKCGRMLPLCHDGLSLAELTALASEGVPITRNRTMFAGYRTYVVAAVMFMLGAANMMGYPIPEEVWMMLGAVGLGTLRAAVEGK